MRLILTLILCLCLPLTLLAAGSGKAKPVTVIPYGKLRLLPQHSAPATVTALNRSRLSAEINAKIDAIHVKVGEQVEQHAPLVSLDCRDHRSRLNQQKSESARLKSQVKQAENRLKRARNLKTDKNISEEQLENRETELISLHAQLQAQRETVEQHHRNVERCTLKAPYSGQVEARLASEGELAAPGTPLIELLQLGDAEVEANIRPERATQLNNAQAHFTYLNRSYPLKPARLSSSLDAKTRTLMIRLTFASEQAPTGAAGRLVWQDPRHHIPADYIQLRNGRLGVFIADNGIARFLLLQDAMEGRPAPIELTETASIIDQGRHGLIDGDKIKEIFSETGR